MEILEELFWWEHFCSKIKPIHLDATWKRICTHPVLGNFSPMWLYAVMHNNTSFSHWIVRPRISRSLTVHSTFSEVVKCWLISLVQIGKMRQELVKQLKVLLQAGKGPKTTRFVLFWQSSIPVHFWVLFPLGQWGAVISPLLLYATVGQSFANVHP